jgi:type IV secretion system protein VirB11
MHANGAFEAFEQLTALIKDSSTGAHLDTDYIKQRLFTTLDIVLFYHQRRLREIYYDPMARLQYLSQSKRSEAAVSSPKIVDQVDERKKMEERYHMAAAYMRAINASNRSGAEAAAVSKHPQLKSIFSARDSIIMQATSLGNFGMVTDSVDDRIVDTILHGQTESISAVISKNSGQHSAHHEAENALI